MTSFMKQALSQALATILGTIIAIVVLVGLAYLGFLYLSHHPEIIKRLLRKMLLG